MDAELRISELRQEAACALRPLFDRDFRLLEVPDYPNPGDMLIFQGETEFFKTLPVRCLEKATMSSFAARNPKIGKDDLLVFSGGGYFGDLWPRGPKFQKMVLERYPDNPMVVLPQSVCFRSRESLEEAVARYGRHRNLSICLRDRQSFELVKKHFANPAYLVPDMAFFADLSGFEDARPVPVPGKKLLLARTDKEFADSPALKPLESDPEIDKADWPTLEKDIPEFKTMKRLRRHARILGKLADSYARGPFRKAVVRSALGLLSPYETVFTTRLHGGIFAILTGKKAVFADNSYGKISSLFDTWLRNCDQASMIRGTGGAVT